MNSNNSNAYHPMAQIDIVDAVQVDPGMSRFGFQFT